MKNHITITLLGLWFLSCTSVKNDDLQIEIFQTSASGDKLALVTTASELSDPSSIITINPEVKYQTITGFGGAFTESSAYLLNQVSAKNRQKILNAYFSDSGAQYSLTRTHMNSCDFSLGHYSYASIEGDTSLAHFSVNEDMDDIIPMILDAQKISKDGFKIIASPWTAPPWMKDNNDWLGGKLIKNYYPTWALFFSKYAKAYANEGIDIWGFTVENEPLGNSSQWESMHFTPEETADFVKNHLGPQLQRDDIDAKILVYDQNRGEELNEWAEVLLKDKELLPYIYGTAVHWYSATVDWFPESLTNTHNLAPDKHILHTEACVDSDLPHWQDDKWYWSKEATDWGFDWASEEQKHKHPKYVPVYRYARDIIGCLNNYVEGWVDWNMVLDTQGGPNWAKNWCNAPVIVDVEKDEIYYTPLYYTMSHFSKYIRPGAVKIDIESSSEEMLATAVQNADGSIIIILLNPTEKDQVFELKLGNKVSNLVIAGQALQTIIIKS